MADTAPPTRPRRNWLRILLVVSLALNLAVAGLVAGALLRDSGERHRRPGLRDLGFGPFVAALPRDDRRALAARLQEELGPFRERRAAMRRQFDALTEALQAEPYDHAAVTAILTSQQEEVFATQRLGRLLLLEHIAGMEAAERAAFAEELVRKVRHWSHRGPVRRD